MKEISYEDAVGQKEVSYEEATGEVIPKQEFTGESTRTPEENGLTDFTAALVGKGKMPEASAYGLDSLRKFFTPEGGSVVDRIKLSLKQTPQDRINFLKGRFGEGNVRFVGDSEPGVGGVGPESPNKEFVGYGKLTPQVREDGKDWYKFGGDNFTISDVAGSAVPIADVAAHVGVGMLPGGTSPVAQGLTSAITSSAKKVAGALLPGGTTQNAPEILADIAVDSGVTAAAQLGVNKFIDAVDYLRPSNYVAREYQKALSTPQGRKGQLLSERNPNVVMTPGQESQSPTLLSLDEAGKKSIFAKKKAATFYDNQITQSVLSAKKALEILDKTGLDNVGRGKLFNATVDKAIDHGYAARDSHAIKNYAFVNDSPDVPVKATYLYLDLEDITKSYAGLRTAIKKGETVLSDFFDEAGNIVNSVGLKKAIDNRRVFANIARGKGTVYPSLSDQGMNREIGKRLVRAIEKDIDDAGVFLSSRGEFGKKLSEANKQYAMDSQAIRDIRDTTFGRLLGTNKSPTPEDFVAALKSAKGTKMDALLEMSKHEPQFKEAAKGAVVEDLLSSARKAPNAPAHQTADFDPYKYVEAAYGWDRSALGKLFDSSEQRRALIDTISMMKRIRGNESLGGGQPLAQPIKEGAMSAVSGSWTFATSWVAKWLVSPAVNKAILDPTGKGQAAIRTIRNTRPGTKAYANAVAYLSFLADKESSTESGVSELARKEQ